MHQAVKLLAIRKSKGRNDEISSLGMKVQHRRAPGKIAEDRMIKAYINPIIR